MAADDLPAASLLDIRDARTMARGGQETEWSNCDASGVWTADERVECYELCGDLIR